jgi:hypothetical protein
MLERQITPDAQLAATFMKAFSWAGDVETTHSLFTKRLPEWNIEPDVYHYNAMLYGRAKEGDWPAVDALTRSVATRFSAPLSLITLPCAVGDDSLFALIHRKQGDK